MKDTSVWSFLSTKASPTLIERYDNDEEDEVINTYRKQFQCIKIAGARISGNSAPTPWLWVRRPQHRTHSKPTGVILELVDAARKNYNMLDSMMETTPKQIEDLPDVRIGTYTCTLGAGLKDNRSAMVWKSGDGVESGGKKGTIFGVCWENSAHGLGVRLCIARSEDNCVLFVDPLKVVQTGKTTELTTGDYARFAQQDYDTSFSTSEAYEESKYPQEGSITKRRQDSKRKKAEEQERRRLEEETQNAKQEEEQERKRLEREEKKADEEGQKERKRL